MTVRPASVAHPDGSSSVDPATGDVTLRIDPATTAVVCVDVQRLFTDMVGAPIEPPLNAVLPRIGRFVEDSRKAGATIVLVRTIIAPDAHSRSTRQWPEFMRAGMAPDTPGSTFDPCLNPQPGDIEVVKQRYSANGPSRRSSCSASPLMSAFSRRPATPGSATTRRSRSPTAAPKSGLDHMTRRSPGRRAISAPSARQTKSPRTGGIDSRSRDPPRNPLPRSSGPVRGSNWAESPDPIPRPDVTAKGLVSCVDKSGREEFETRLNRRQTCGLRFELRFGWEAGIRTR